MHHDSSVERPHTVRFEAAALRVVLDLFARARGVEPCGLLLGRHERGGSTVHVIEAVALANEHARPHVGWCLSPEAQLAASRVGRQRSLRVVGTWHGHPHSPPMPSDADVEGHEAFRLTAEGSPLLVIVGRGAGAIPVVRAYTTDGGHARELPIRH